MNPEPIVRGGRLPRTDIRKENNMERTTYDPTAATTWAGMSQLVRVGNLVFLSGQCSQDEHGEVVGEGDPEAQVRQCFENIRQLLASQGGTLADIVKLTCFLATSEAYPAYAEAKRARFPSDPPTGTAIVVTALLDPRFLLEVDVIAVIGEG